MSIKHRLAQLEKRRNEQPFEPPKIIEVWGTREDGTRYLIETWRQLIEAETIEPAEAWQEFIGGEVKP